MDIVGFFTLGEEGKESINITEFKAFCELADKFGNVEAGTTLKRLVANESNKAKTMAKMDADYYVGVQFRK